MESWNSSSLTSKKKESIPVYSYSVVDPIQVGVETLVVPPSTVGDLSTDVPTVWCSEALLVVVPAEGVLSCTTVA